MAANCMVQSTIGCAANIGPSRRHLKSYVALPFEVPEDQILYQNFEV